MATAGRILIMPKGPWAAETEYEMLDLVAHNGRAWIAKKVSVGIEPGADTNEYWHDFLGTEITPEAIGALSIGGGVLTGNLTVSKDGYPMLYILDTSNNGRGMWQQDGGRIVIETREDVNDANNFVRLALSANESTALKNKISLAHGENGEIKWYDLYGQHNKTSGHYIGDGSATSRTINIGGIGEAILLINPARSWTTLVTASGSFGWGVDGTTKTFDKSEIEYSDGKNVILKTADNGVNGNGNTIFWSRL